MAFDHNDHYHRLLLRHVPPGARTALDVGCGTGRFARRLAARGIAVDAVDPSREAIDAAVGAETASAAGPGEVRYRCEDVTEVALPRAHYDVVTCLASLHHMPFGTVAALRDALAPGGVLLVLGCYPERSRTDWAWSLAAVPVNAVARLGVWGAEGLGLRPAAPASAVRAPVAPPRLAYDDIRREAAELLPGARTRRLLFWRYLLVHRAAARAV